MDRVDAALSDGRVENRKGQVRSLIDLRNSLSGRLERWLREFGVTRRREPSGSEALRGRARLAGPGPPNGGGGGGAVNLGTQRPVTAGRIDVPHVPGIGFELHDEAWQAFRSLVPPPD